MARFERLEIPVAGGNLHVGSWGEGEVSVLALHGLTLNHAEFHLLGESLAGSSRIVAPDLRGRGGSAYLAAPYGLEAHVQDIAAVLRHLARAPVILVGHSWGAVLALAVAHSHPDLVRSIFMVDGGLPPTTGRASDQSTDRASQRVLARLNSNFASVDAYLDIWRSQPGLGRHWNEHIERAFATDLAGTAPSLHCSLKAEAFMADLSSTYVQGNPAERAMLELRHRATLIRAARNMADEEQPQYSDAVAREWCNRVVSLHDRLVLDENHYTILLGETGAKHIADLIREELHRN
jgi:pimeloyl-ACP methyl ester carboxylesterase